MWSSGIMLGLRRLVLGYCIFVFVLVWMLKRAKRIRDTQDTATRADRK